MLLDEMLDNAKDRPNHDRKAMAFVVASTILALAALAGLLIASGPVVTRVTNTIFDSFVNH